MNEQPDLLNVTPSAPSALTAARLALERAQADWDECMELDNSPIRGRLGQRVNAAEAVVARLERAAMKQIDPYEAFEAWCINNGFADVINCEPEDVNTERLNAAVAAYGAQPATDQP